MLQLKLRVNSVFKRNRRGDDMEVDSPARPESKMDEGETPVVDKDRPTDVLVDAATRKLSAPCPENAASSGTARLESEMGEGERRRPGVDEMSTTLRRGNSTNPDAGTGGLEHLVPWRVAMAATLSEMAYDEPKESLRELLLNLQLRDASVRRWKQSISEGRSRDAGSTTDTLRDW